MNLTPVDKAALEIGRLFMRAHAAEEVAARLAQQLAEAAESTETTEESITTFKR